MPSGSTSLSPEYRAKTLDALDGGEFDVIVVGGGVTGAGCALDAVSRGLSVALFEQRDFASGTSSRSSKLIHGGLRYLEHFHFQLVNEALRERGLLHKVIAPHLVWPIPFVYPLKHRLWERLYVGAGVTLYDIMAKLGRTTMPRQWHLSRKELLRVFPGIKKKVFVGGVQYYDGGTDDARFVLALARTAAAEGANLLTSASVSGFLRDGHRISGVVATCLESGRAFETRAKVVINATGVWTDSVELLAGDSGTEVTASKGVHIVVPKERIESSVGFITKTATSVLFLIPHDDFWIIGTTDTPWELDLAHPAASESDIQYVLDQVNRIVEIPITTQDIVGVYAGLRPLVTGNAASTAKLSREHSVTQTEPGLITIAGGKFTTYRVMAKDTVNEASEIGRLHAPASRTDEIPLVGADGYVELMARKDDLAERYELPLEQIVRLLHRYGGEVEQVLSYGKEDPAMLQLIPSGTYLRAEVRFAVEHEGALHLDDVLTRRTRISIESKDRGVDSAPDVASIMASILDWDDVTVKRELEHYDARVAAERESQTMPDDLTADAARLGAPDVRTLGE